MSFSVIIPARYASTRLPGQAARRHCRQADGRAGRRARAACRRQSRVVVATDDERVRAAVDAHRHRGLHDARRSSDRHRSPGGGRAKRWDLPTKPSSSTCRATSRCSRPSLIRAVAELLAAHPDAAIATACHPIVDPAEAFNPNVVKVVLDASRLRALFQPGDDSLGARRVRRRARRAAAGAAAVPALRALRVPGAFPAALSRRSRRRRSSDSRRSNNCARCGTATGSSWKSPRARRRPASTRRKISRGPIALRPRRRMSAVPAPRDN